MGFTSSSLYAQSLCVASLVSAAILAPPANAVHTVLVRPGTAISEISGGITSECTVGFVGTNTAKQQLAFTAGHCVRKIGDLVRDRSTGTIIGRYVAASSERLGSADMSGFAIVLLSPNAQPVASAAGWRLAGQATPEAKTQICHIGATSGTNCGQVLATYPDEVITSMTSRHGDSGGPAFTNGTPGTKLAVGFIIGSNNKGQTLVNPLDNYLNQVQNEGGEYGEGATIYVNS